MPSTDYIYDLVRLKLEYFSELVDDNYYIGWKEGRGMVDWQGNDIGPRGHPLKLGHQRIAERIYEHIRSLGWL